MAAWSAGLAAAFFLLPACAPEPPAAAAPPTLRQPAGRDAPLPPSWRLERGRSWDSINGRIYAPSKQLIHFDIGPMAADFQAPARTKCLWMVEGQDPDWFAFTKIAEPAEIQLRIRNENAEGGAFAFWFTPRDPAQVTLILEQLLASHDWIRSRLIAGGEGGIESPR